MFWNNGDNLNLPVYKLFFSVFDNNRLLFHDFQNKKYWVLGLYVNFPWTLLRPFSAYKVISGQLYPTLYATFKYKRPTGFSLSVYRLKRLKKVKKVKLSDDRDFSIKVTKDF